MREKTEKELKWERKEGREERRKKVRDSRKRRDER